MGNRRSGLLVVCALLLAAQGAAALACDGSFAGRWDTTKGLVEIHMDANRATLVFGDDSERYSGVVTGGVLEGGWTRSSEFGQGMGHFRLVMSKDRRQFTGRWQRVLGVGSLEGEFNGQCVSRRKGGT